MADAKIEVKVGAVSFTGEGTESWLSTELEKFIKHVPDLAKVAPAPPADGGGKGAVDHGQVKKTGTLAAYLTSKNASSNQTRKFLTTALFLQDGGHEHLTTSVVTKTLEDKKQGKLTNASQCLSDNVSAGFCEKKGNKEFYVTEEGKTEIG